MTKMYNCMLTPKHNRMMVQVGFKSEPQRMFVEILFVKFCLSDEEFLALPNVNT